MGKKNNRNPAVFQWVQHTPVGRLKDMHEQELSHVRQMLIKEVREVGRALHWVDGIIKVKQIEQQKAVRVD